jgi:hypothetical protein
VCILCEYTIRSSRLNCAHQRAEFSQARFQIEPPAETFNASKLLLDLDAADSEFVRPYTETLREPGNPDRQKSNCGKPKKVDIMKFPGRKTTANVTHEQRNRMLRRVRDIYRATGADYLSLAINPRLRNGYSGLSPVLREIISRNGTSLTMRSFKRIIKDLKNNGDRELEPKEVTRKYGHLHDEGTYLRLLDCKNLEDLRRTTHLMAMSLEGCRFLSNNAGTIVQALKSCRIHEGASTDRILSFINALTQRIEGQGVDPGEPLCDAGMYYAARSGCVTALRRYLEATVAYDYSVVPSQHRMDALSVAVRCGSKGQALTGGDYPVLVAGRVRDATLDLLTGWDGDGVPSPGQYRKPCFASLINGNDMMYYRYITGLGRLQATDILWHEWMNPELTPIPESLEQAGRRNNRPDIFIFAFFLANDHTRAFLIALSANFEAKERMEARKYLLDRYETRTSSKSIMTHLRNFPY